MKRCVTVPLGIDVGSSRTRVALLEREPQGAFRLVSVATRPTLDDAPGAILAAWRELGTRERRCVLAVGAPDSAFAVVRFPAMGARERRRAARYEASRLVPFPVDEAVLRIVDLDEGRCALAAARRAALDARLAAVRRAGLRPVAVDDAAFALTRAYAGYDAIVDFGERATTLVVPSNPLPSVRSVATGGRALTAAIVAALAIDEGSAEQRKRSMGLAGAGDHARDALVDQLATALIEARADGRTDLRSIALTGNGARLPRLATDLERALSIPVRLCALAPARCSLPADVLNAASPDWALAYGLALWSAA